MKKKLDQNIQNLDPQIKMMFDECKKQLESIQEEKEAAIDEFLEEQTEDKIMSQKVIEKKFKKLLADFEKNIDDDNVGDGPSLEEYKT